MSPYLEQRGKMFQECLPFSFVAGRGGAIRLMVPHAKIQIIFAVSRLFSADAVHLLSPGSGLEVVALVVRVSEALLAEDIVFGAGVLDV